MNDLDSSLDAFLFINNTTLSFLVYNVWTWVAVLAAAVSFWRFSRSGAAVNKNSIKSAKCSQTQKISASPSFDHRRDEPAESRILSTSSKIVSTRGFVSISSPIDHHQVSQDSAVTNCKGKFFTVFEGDDQENDEMDDEVAEIENDWMEVEGGCDVDHAVVDEWQVVEGHEEEEEELAAEIETVLSLRMKDMGWYRCQDLGVFDGSVVKLWEESRSPTPSPRRRCSSPVGGVVRCGW